MSRIRFIVLSIVTDAVLVNVAFVLAFLIRFEGRLPAYNFGAYVILAPVLTVLYIGGAWIYGLYDPERADTAWAVARGVVGAVTVGTVLVAAVAFFGSTRTASFARSTLLLAWALDMVLLIGWRLSLLRLANLRWPEQRVLIVGTDPISLELAEKVAQRGRWGWRMTGLVDDVPDPRYPPPTSILGFPVLGTVEEVARIAADHRANRLIIASPIALREYVESLVLTNELKVRVDVVPDLYEVFIGTVDAIIGDVPLMEISRTTVPRYFATVKRMADIAVSIVGLVVSSPVLLVACAAIALDDGFPVFFSQERMGQNMKPFPIHKLRTMVKHAEKISGPTLADEKDFRITATGRFLRRFRIDELPQLVNILKGEMSFVGPRPERPYFVEQYATRVAGYRERFRVKPGVTGLAQVNGSYATTPERKLKYDLIYIYHRSLVMELQIVTETLRVVLTGRGAR